MSLMWPEYPLPEASGAEPTTSSLYPGKFDGVDAVPDAWTTPFK